MSSNKVCVIIPIHPPHFHFAHGIFESLLDTDREVLDIWFVFTTLQDQAAFASMYVQQPYQSITLEGNVSNEGIHCAYKNNTVAIFKKMYALQYVSQLKAYKYAIGVDAEVKFINAKMLPGVCEKYCMQDKVLVGGTVMDHGHVTGIRTRCLSYFTHEPMYDVVLKPYENLYFWYSNLPIYDLDIVPNFLAYIKFDREQSARIFTWHDFEYILYYYYAMMFHGYKVTWLDNFTWSLENCDATTWNNVHTQITPLYWMFHKTYDQCNRNDIVMIYHLDR